MTKITAADLRKKAAEKSGPGRKDGSMNKTTKKVYDHINPQIKAGTKEVVVSVADLALNPGTVERACERWARENLWTVEVALDEGVVLVKGRTKEQQAKDAAQAEKKKGQK